MTKQMNKAIAYYRTSSASNVGEGKDSHERQRRAVRTYAKRHHLVIAAEYYDKAVSGSAPIHERPQFTELLERLESNGVGVVLVEDPTRFARDLMVQLSGHAKLSDMGVELIAVNAPEHFREDTPTAELVRQVLGAISQFEKAQLVIKLRVARDRRSKVLGRRCEGRPPVPGEAKRQARRLRRKRLSLRAVAAELSKLGYNAPDGKPYRAGSIKHML